MIILNVMPTRNPPLVPRYTTCPPLFYRIKEVPLIFYTDNSGNKTIKEQIQSEIPAGFTTYGFSPMGLCLTTGLFCKN